MGRTAETRRSVLRPQSGGPAGDARHHRRRRSQRAFQFRDRDDPRRSAGHHVRDRWRCSSLALGLTLIMLAVMPFVILVTGIVPPLGLAQLPADPRRHREDQRVSAGARQRHRGAATVQSRKEERGRISSASTASTWSHSRIRSPRTAGSTRSSNCSACWHLAAMLAWGGFRSSTERLTLGVLVAFFQYGMRFFRPIQDLSEKYNILQSAMAASERIFKLLDTEPTIVESARRACNESAQAAASSSIMSGSPTRTTTGCCRTSASPSSRARRSPSSDTPAPGKTTLTNLLLRFYDVQKGSIRIGGMDVRDYDLHDSAEAVRHRAAGSVPVHRNDRGQHPARHRGYHATQAIEKAADEVNLRDYVDRLAGALRDTGARARSGLLDRPEAADQLRPRAGA